jgi:hypothetical protein
MLKGYGTDHGDNIATAKISRGMKWKKMCDDNKKA